MKLKTKATILLWSLTAMLIVPGLLFALIAFVLLAARQELIAKDIASLIRDMAAWRDDTVRQYVIDQKQGFRLTIKN